MSADGARVVTGSVDALAKVWDAESGVCLCTLDRNEDPAVAVAISSDGAHVVTGSAEALARVWDAETGVCLCILKNHTDRIDRIVSIAMSADGARVVIAFETGALKVWDAPRLPQHALAFAMALHPRLGAACLARELDPTLMQLIGEHFVAPCWAGE